MRMSFADAFPHDLILGLLALAAFGLLWLRRRAIDRAATPPSPSEWVGPLTRAQLQALPGFGPHANGGYEPDPQALALLRQAPLDWRALIFVGTWCPDSRREVPPFLRIIDQVGLPEAQLELVGLDRAKTDPEGLSARYRISRVPTIVVIQGERELGRIVERPVTSLEGDLVEILRLGSGQAR
jgi:hypothetical protein